MSKNPLSILPLIIFLFLVVGIAYIAFSNSHSQITEPTVIATKKIVPTLIAANPSATTIVPPASTSTPVPADTSTLVPTLTSASIDTPTKTTTPTPSSTPTHTATATPPSTLTPTPISEAIVVAKELNLRAGPGTNYALIGVLNQGDAMDIQGRLSSNEWLQVVPSKLDTLGWVNTAPEFIKISTDLNTIATVIPPTPPSTPTPSVPVVRYPVAILTGPDNGVGTLGAFPPLYWDWDGQLADDEYFEVRVWHEDLPYHAALGWVKQPQFDYNVSGERNGKYYWAVTIIRGKNPKAKDWIKPGWPYQVWDGELVTELSPESENRFFFFTVSGGGGGPISKPPPR